jgi:hypothetical protein
LNLAGQPNKDIIDCYFPAQVIKTREYEEEKEALKAADEQAKFDRKIKPTANTLKKKQEEKEKAQRKAEREAKAARKQLPKDLCYGVGGTRGAARRLDEERSHLILSPARRGKQSPVYLSSFLS